MGDRVVVHGGYDMDPDWLLDGDGYTGTIRKLTPHAAAVELDDELELEGPDGRLWQDFGQGSRGPMRAVPVARGKWLVLTHGWEDQSWTDPVRLHVGLCELEPDLDAIPRGGGIGYGVESHAGIAPVV